MENIAFRAPACPTFYVQGAQGGGGTVMMVDQGVCLWKSGITFPDGRRSYS
jgi:hypothetical protein